MPELVSIIFIRSAGKYSAGEIAGFNEETARRYVEQGIGNFYKATPADEPSEAASDDDSPSTGKAKGNGKPAARTRRSRTRVMESDAGEDYETK